VGTESPALALQQRMPHLPAVRLILLSLLLPASLLSQATLDTRGVGGHIPSFVSPIAKAIPGSTSRVFGQTFTVPTVPDTRLQSFSFWLAGNTDFAFRAFLMAWDDASFRATGPILFESGDRTTVSGPVLPPDRFDFDAGGLTLTAGAMYVAFVTPYSSPTPTTSQAGSGFMFSSTYSGGMFVQAFPRQDLAPLDAQLVSSSWTGNLFNSGSDLAFAATFGAAVVPEPSTVIFVATGLAAIAAFARRRRPAA
jgi:hypothetical protein